MGPPRAIRTKSMGVPKARATKQTTKRFDDVHFQFLGPDTDLDLTGSVLLRTESMVIDIPAQNGYDPCLIERHLAGHVYSGSNTLSHEDPLRV